MFEMVDKRVVVRGVERLYRVLPHPGSVAILAIEDGSVALIRQLRPAVEDQIWEVPAGTLGPGETPEACARRELEEETGLVAQEMELLTSFYLAPGYTTERMHLFAARRFDRRQQRLDEGEVIEPVHWVPIEDAVRMALEGAVEDAKTLAALFWLATGAVDGSGRLKGAQRHPG